MLPARSCARASRDLVALRVVVTGTKDGQRSSRAWELVDFFDAQRGITAMMRTTGYTLSITGQLQATGADCTGRAYAR